MKIKMIEFVPSKNVEPTNRKIKSIFKDIGSFKWHRQATNCIQKREMQRVMGTRNIFSERLIFEMNFQGWIEFDMWAEVISENSRWVGETEPKHEDGDVNTKVRCFCFCFSSNLY